MTSNPRKSVLEKDKNQDSCWEKTCETSEKSVCSTSRESPLGKFPRGIEDSNDFPIVNIDESPSVKSRRTSKESREIHGVKLKENLQDEPSRGASQSSGEMSTEGSKRSSYEGQDFTDGSSWRGATKFSHSSPFRMESSPHETEKNLWKRSSSRYDKDLQDNATWKEESPPVNFPTSNQSENNWVTSESENSWKANYHQQTYRTNDHYSELDQQKRLWGRDSSQDFSYATNESSGCWNSPEMEKRSHSWMSENTKNPSRRMDSSPPRTPTFTSLALDVSYAGLDTSSSNFLDARTPKKNLDDDPPEFWEDISVIEFLDRKLASNDESTPEERVEVLKEILADTDIHEGDGVVSDFLFHVARTKYGKIYIRVIRTFLLNRVLCSNRVSQMTKTYNDIEAVTRLLEEKEKDLELTARIGKELLSHNQKLEAAVASLESDLKEANEQITQLNHELAKKTELIQILTNDADESSSEAGTPTGIRGISLDMMQKKISNLEDENLQLRSEFAKLMHDADHSEEQEAKLVKDIAAQLASANMEVDGIVDELERQKEENRIQHEQIVSLTAKLAETELRLAQLLAEHDEVGATLLITRDNQNTLASELAEFKDRYAEVVNLLAETQEQLRKQRKKGMPIVRGGSLFPSMGAAPQPDSIASELETSLYSELSLDSGISTDRIPTYKKVFETVRSASRSSYAANDSNQFPRMVSMTTSTLSSGSMGPRMSCGQIRPVTSTYPSLDSAGHSDSEGSLLTDFDDYPGSQQTGVPGAPGAADLEAALRRLTSAEVLARRACLSTGAGYSYDYDTGMHSPSTFVPLECRTPDSIMSTGSSGNLSGYSGGNAWRIPEKLQIIKPIEGSQTLHHWMQLATPTLGGLLEERPGVKTRGGRGLEDLGLVTFTLSDLEEDEEYTNPGKLFQDTGSVYTFTNSTVLHPDDHTSVTPSIVGSRVATAPSSALNSGMSTPRTLSRRNSTSTFSTTLGLAKMLNERGIKAVTPSCVGTPSGERNYTPTATPCNSPDGSPLESRSSSPTPDGGLSMGLLSSGAELLKRTFGGEAEVKRKRLGLSRSDKKALTGIRLVEKLERIGIDTIMASTVGSSISPLALQGSLYTRRSTESPMAQLTFLKSSMSSSGSQEKLSPSSVASESSSTKQKITEKRQEGSSRQRRTGARATRPDLGRVTSAVPPVVTKESPAQSALGTISSLLFGRKGGLL